MSILNQRIDFLKKNMEEKLAQADKAHEKAIELLNEEARLRKEAKYISNRIEVLL